ncbi:MAG TPA: MBL fold metallo-hydrolase [Deltaproteobacteria bacterium]|nr:MBL fold metallo-hydrolase [Deltaproteobacteria bacterium]
MTGNNSAVPPRSNEIEVSLFGPGYGESVLIHLGLQQWIIVDSCIDQNSHRPAALGYLENLGVDPAQAVKLIVVTHWHDDHIKGLGELMASCNLAKFVCSAALRCEEFLELVESYSQRSMMRSSGVEEFRKVLDVLKTRKSKYTELSPLPKFAISDRLLWKNPPEAAIPCEVFSLSPSDMSLNLAFQEIKSLLPQEGERKKRIIARGPNHAAVVLWINVRDTCLLLGSDLEESSIAGTGWSVIVDSKTRPDGRAFIFKIPHHGSKNADQPQVWQNMLVDEVMAITTPFLRGSVNLPTKSDVDRICSRTSHAYITAPPKRRRLSKSSGAIAKTIRETVRDIRECTGQDGQIRLRLNLSELPEGTWNVELFGASCDLRHAVLSAQGCSPAQ